MRDLTWARLLVDDCKGFDLEPPHLPPVMELSEAASTPSVCSTVRPRRHRRADTATAAFGGCHLVLRIC
jgi:hypothetical protein